MADRYLRRHGVAAVVPLPPTHEGRARRALLGGTLALTMGAGAIPLFSVAALAPVVVADLGMSRTELGFASTVSFVLAAAWCTIAGDIIDHLGARRTMTLLFGVSAGVVLLLMAASSYAWLLAVAAASAFAQALSNPLTNHVVARDVPEGERGWLMGVKQSGVQLVQFVTGAVLPVTAPVIGWRNAIGTMTLLPLASMGLARAVVRADDPDASVSRPDRRRQVAWTAPLAAYGFLMGAALQAVNVYTPLYTFEGLGATAALAGATTGAIGGIGVAGRVLLGRAADRMDTPESLLSTLALGAAAATVLLALAEAGGYPFLLVGILIYAATAVSSNVVVMMTVVRLAPPGAVGAASGRVALGMYLGFATGPLAFGAIVDATTSYRLGWMVVIALFLMAAGTTLLFDDPSRPKRRASRAET